MKMYEVDSARLMLAYRRGEFARDAHHGFWLLLCFVAEIVFAVVALMLAYGLYLVVLGG